MQPSNRKGKEMPSVSYRCFSAKSANQSQNSKGPCEDGGGNWYKYIYTHSKTTPILFHFKGHSAKKKPKLQNHTKNIQTTVCNCT